MIETVDLNKNSVSREFLHRSEIRRMVPRIIAFDPGETTGWTMIEPDLTVMTEGLNLTDNIKEFKHGQIDCGKSQGQLLVSDKNDPGLNPMGEAQGVYHMVALCDSYPEAVIVVEDFIVNFKQITKARASLSPVRITAKLEHELWQRGRSIILQPTAIKSTMSDRRLKEFGVYQREGALRHARDSDRHALYFLRSCQIKPGLRHRAWPWLFEEPVVKVRKQGPKKPPGQRINFG